MNSTSFLGAHVLVLGTWLVATATLAGIGRLTLAWFGRRLECWRDVSATIWLGVATSISAAQLWSFFGPVDGVLTIVLVLLGVAGLWHSRRELASLVRRSRRPSWPLVLGLVVLIVWMANRAIGPSRLYDTGMYHQPFVNWANAHAVVPGLGNLHGRLAFNPSALLFAALFDVGALDRLALHLTNGLLYAVLAVEAVAAWGAMRHEAAPRAFHLFSLAILPNVVHGVMRPDVRSLSTDAAVAAMLFAAFRLLFDAFAHRDPDRGVRGPQGAIILTLLTAAVTMKLSAAPVAAGCAVLAVALWLRRGAADDALTSRAVVRWVAPAVVLWAAWTARSVVLSGYPLYPTALLPFDVDWRVPAEQVAGEQAWIEASARNLNTNIVYPGLSWVRPWLRHVVVTGDLFVEFTVPLLLLGVLGALVVFRLVRRSVRAPAHWSHGWWWTGAPLALGTLIWATTAPHPRLLQAIAWSAVGVLASFVAVSWPGRRRTPANALGIAAACLTAALTLKQGVDAARGAGPAASQIAKAWFTLPSEPILEPLPPREYLVFRTNSGLQVVVPDGDNRCYNGPLVCTPHPSPKLAARVPGDVSRGFRTVDGRWEPARWPNPWSRFLPFWRCSREGTASRDDREGTCQRTIMERASAAE